MNTVTKNLKAVATILPVGIVLGHSPKPAAVEDQPVEVVDTNIDTIGEAVDLVLRWQEEGFTSLEGLYEGETGSAALWDPERCAPNSGNNGVVLTLGQVTSGGPAGIELDDPDDPRWQGVNVSFLRSCLGEDPALFRYPLPVLNNGSTKPDFETLSGYQSSMAAAAHAAVNRSQR